MRLRSFHPSVRFQHSLAQIDKRSNVAWQQHIRHAGEPLKPHSASSLLFSGPLCLISGSPKYMNRLLAVTVLSTVTLLCGCVTLDPEPTATLRDTELPSHIVAASTAELTTRRAQIDKMIFGIEREVEMKAGLHMGVAIHDDRSQLNELYLEARHIDRELLRRWNSGDGAARMETVKAY